MKPENKRQTDEHTNKRLGDIQPLTILLLNSFPSSHIISKYTKMH